MSLNRREMLRLGAAGALFRRLLVMTAQLHLAVDALALQLLLERAQRLVDIIVANDDLHKKPSNSLQNRPFVVGPPGSVSALPTTIPPRKNIVRR